MNPEIRRYLDEHGATYTPEALRRGLLDAGYDPPDVDAALREWGVQAAEPASSVADRRRFWRWAFGLHAAVLVAITIASVLIGSFATGSWGLLIVLAVVLLIGLGISGLAGRGMVHGSGLTVAILIPAVSALLIGGTCLAIGAPYLLRAPPRTGVMTLRIEPPLSFEGSGAAHCDTSGSRFQVWADDLGKLDGSSVSVYLDSTAQAAPTGADATNLSISLYPPSETEPPVGYSPIFSTRFELDASPDARSGTLRFEGLEPSLLDRPPGQVPGREPISGTVTWKCR